MAYNTRQAVYADLDQLQNLYLHLNMSEKLTNTPELDRLWQEIITDSNYHIFVIEADDKLVASCTLVVIKNLTHQMRPYALVENVVTHTDYRNQGYGKTVLAKAINCAREYNCYKVMLLTGSKKESTLKFYENAGFNQRDKTGFVQWL
ncbi:MAG TPA: GNAT family N-acetyltransferase [Bacillota bacterium]|nr:GNAT family N-acetyltransferase [Bacillota bacterium]